MSLSAYGNLGELHEGPDSKDNSNDKHNNEEDQAVEELGFESTEGGSCDPEVEEVVPGGGGDTDIFLGLGEVREWESIVVLDQISGFPHKDNTAEETD